ncbi:unnamed protein product [Symbiodinium necroappetens]|uniref:Uncharacterized protein n=1 Tax=Symbiodinium necroappetens TaxID=1628268 RepID=A0A812YGU8_9DINO|nr:unnamed protein product [Symbiodinium necroappetens]
MQALVCSKFHAKARSETLPLNHGNASSEILELETGLFDAKGSDFLLDQKSQCSELCAVLPFVRPVCNPLHRSRKCVITQPQVLCEMGRLDRRGWVVMSSPTPKESCT